MAPTGMVVGTARPRREGVGNDEEPEMHDDAGSDSRYIHTFSKG